MSLHSEIIERLRDRVIAGLHLGELHAGDRLAGVRDVAEEHGVGVRAVVRAYRVLEREGLVEIRTRSGVYVGPQERLDGEVLAETARWMAGVLAEAWRRRIPIPDLPALVRRCTASVRLRCAVIEATEDHRVALAAEASDDWGLHARAVPFRAGRTGAGVPIITELRQELADADLALTTAFCAAAVRPAAEVRGIPLLVVTVNPDIVAFVQRRLRSGELTVVCAEPAFGERVRSIAGREVVGRVRVVLADDARGVAALDAAEPVLLTRAARERLGDVRLPLLVPHSQIWNAPTLHFSRTAPMATPAPGAALLRRRAKMLRSLPRMPQPPTPSAHRATPRRRPAAPFAGEGGG